MGLPIGEKAEQEEVHVAGEVGDYEEVGYLEGKLQVKAPYFLVSSGRIRRWRQMTAGVAAERIAMAMEILVTILR